ECAQIGKKNTQSKRKACCEAARWPKPASEKNCPSISFRRQGAFERIGPGIAQEFEWAVDHRAPFYLDAESIAADDLTDGVCRYAVLSRSLENASKQSWLNGNDGASAAFVEEGEFGGGRKVGQIEGRAEGRKSRFLAALGMTSVRLVAKLGRSMLRPYRRRSRRGERRFTISCEAGFGDSDGETAVTDVVRGLHKALGGEGNE